MMIFTVNIADIDIRFGLFPGQLEIILKVVIGVKHHVSELPQDVR